MASIFKLMLFIRDQFLKRTEDTNGLLFFCPLSCDNAIYYHKKKLFSIKRIVDVVITTVKKRFHVVIARQRIMYFFHFSTIRSKTKQFLRENVKPMINFWLITLIAVQLSQRSYWCSGHKQRPNQSLLFEQKYGPATAAQTRLQFSVFSLKHYCDNK